MGINVNPSWLHETTSINCKSKCLGVRFEFKFTTKALLFLWGLLNIRLTFKVNLFKGGIVNKDSQPCVMNRGVEETVQHLFPNAIFSYQSVAEAH